MTNIPLDDFSSLDYGQFDDGYPQPEMRNDIIDELRDRITAFNQELSTSNPLGIDSIIPPEVQDREREKQIYKAVSFQSTAILTALSHSLLHHPDNLAESMNKLLTRFGYFEFTHNALILGPALSEISEMVTQNPDGTFTISAYFEGKIMRQSIVVPSAHENQIASYDINFIYTNGHTFEVRDSNKGRSINVYSADTLLLKNPADRDWLNAIHINIPPQSDARSYLKRVGHLNDNRPYMEFVSPAHNPDQRTIDIYNIERTAQVGEMTLTKDGVDYKGRRLTLDHETLIDSKVKITRQIKDVRFEAIDIEIEELIRRFNLDPASSEISSVVFNAEGTPEELTFVGDSTFGSPLVIKLGKYANFEEVRFESRRYTAKDYKYTSKSGRVTIITNSDLEISFDIAYNLMSNIVVKGTKLQ